MPQNTLLLGTRKGLVTYVKNANSNWVYQDAQFVGIPVTIASYDPVTQTWWALLDHGHWGCKLHRSKNGKDWEELEAPKYPDGEEIKDDVPASTRLLWAFASGGPSRSGTIYVGTEPGGLFKSADNGNSFDLVRSLWDHPSRKEQWFGGGRDHPGIHSILIDPADENHMFIAISCAGMFETTDGGASWQVRNKGLRADYLPDPSSEYGQDPHLIDWCKAHTNVMWQQNHCGIFRTVDAGLNWDDITDFNGPANFGFAVAAHETNPDVAWVVPGVSDINRIAVDQSLCVCRTDDGGKTWQDFRAGLPQQTAFDITYRHALALQGEELVFGTTTGNLYHSIDAGESWNALSNNLPMVHSVEFAWV